MTDHIEVLGKRITDLTSNLVEYEAVKQIRPLSPRESVNEEKDREEQHSLIHAIEVLKKPLPTLEELESAVKEEIKNRVDIEWYGGMIRWICQAILDLLKGER